MSGVNRVAWAVAWMALIVFAWNTGEALLPAAATAAQLAGSAAPATSVGSSNQSSQTASGAPAAPVPPATWHTNFALAQSQAASEKKLLLINFSGSDWCGWCIKLQKDVFQKREFAEYARSNLVLLAVDFPRKKSLPPAQTAANQALAAKFGVEGFPTLVVVNEQGSRLGTLGFAEGGPKSFIRELEKFVARRTAEGNRPAPEPRPARVANASRGGLQLQSIVAKKGHRVARINDLTLSPGQAAKVRVASGEVAIRCVEIRESSVIVKVDGRREPLELKLAQQRL